jgi:L-ribulose-5-phosphate 3-epimerase
MYSKEKSRREFLKASAAIATGCVLSSLRPSAAFAVEPRSLFKISLAEWSFHRALFAGERTQLDFAKTAQEDFGIDVIEYSGHFFKGKAADKEYLKQLRQRSDDSGVRSLLITVDDEGNLGDPDEKVRMKAVDNHRKWMDAGKFLGCESVRVNAHSDDKLPPEEQATLAADGVRRLAEFSASIGMTVLVENHGGISSDGGWLASVVEKVGMPNCGTLPDFGNFHLSDGKQYDRYRGVAELMPFAKAVSAKSHRFDKDGNETATDYRKMLKIVLDAGFHGYVGIEYEGDQLSEPEGIIATKRLLENVREELA